MFTRGYQNPTQCVGLVQSWPIIIISLKINLFSSWYSWKNCWIGGKQQLLTSLTHSMHKHQSMKTKAKYLWSYCRWRQDKGFFLTHKYFLLNNNLLCMTGYWLVVNNQKGNIQSSHQILVKKMCKELSLNKIKHIIMFIHCL